MSEDRIVLEAERRELTGISAMTAWRWERKGEYPKRVALGRDKNGRPVLVGWKLSELQAWIASRQVVTLKAPEERTATAV